MAVPKFRVSASKRDMRRSHDALKFSGMSYCANCGDAKIPHSVCKACGSYKGKVVMKAKAKAGASGEDFNIED